MKKYTKLGDEHELVIAVGDTMREVTHRRPEYEDDEYWVEGEDPPEFVPTISAFVDDELVGSLWMQRGEAHSEHELEVAKVEMYKYEGKGIATVLWAVAKQNFSVGHSGFQTEAGEGWVEHVDAVVSEDGTIDLPEPEAEVLSAYEVRQKVPGFPYKHYDFDDEGQEILFEKGAVDLEKVVPHRVFRALADADAHNDLYLAPAMSAAQWEAKEPRGILTPSWQEIEDRIAAGDPVPIVVQAQEDGTFELLDGHHRASMARHLGIEQLPAFIDWNGVEIDGPQVHQSMGL